MVEAEPHQDPGPCVLYIRCGGTDPATLAALAGLVGQFTPSSAPSRRTRSWPTCAPR